MSERRIYGDYGKSDSSGRHHFTDYEMNEMAEEIARYWLNHIILREYPYGIPLEVIRRAADQVVEISALEGF